MLTTNDFLDPPPEFLTLVPQKRGTPKLVGEEKTKLLLARGTPNVPGIVLRTEGH